MQFKCLLYIFFFTKYLTYFTNCIEFLNVGQITKWRIFFMNILYHIRFKCWRIFLSSPKNRQLFKYILLRSIYVHFPIYSKYTKVTNESFWPFLLPSDVITRNEGITFLSKSNVSYRNQSLNKSIVSKEERWVSEFHSDVQ